MIKKTLYLSYIQLLSLKKKNRKKSKKKCMLCATFRFKTCYIVYSNKSRVKDDVMFENGQIFSLKL